MKRLLVLAVVVAALGLVPAAGAANPAQQIAALQKQVKVLQTQVKLLSGELGLNFEGDTCLGAQTADLFQGTWGVIDSIAQAQATPRTIFGPQTSVSDYKNCGDLSQPAVPRPGIVNPPKIDPFLALLDWLHVKL